MKWWAVVKKQKELERTLLESRLKMAKSLEDDSDSM